MEDCDSEGWDGDNDGSEEEAVGDSGEGEDALVRFRFGGDLNGSGPGDSDFFTISEGGLGEGRDSIWGGEVSEEGDIKGIWDGEEGGEGGTDEGKEGGEDEGEEGGEDEGGVGEEEGDGDAGDASVKAGVDWEGIAAEGSGTGDDEGVVSRGLGFFTKNGVSDPTGRVEAFSDFLVFFVGGDILYFVSSTPNKNNPVNGLIRASMRGSKLVIIPFFA